MAHEEREVIEYNVDYRNTPKTAAKGITVSKSNTKYHKEEVIPKIVAEEKINNIGTIKISQTKRKQIGIYRIFFAVITMVLTIVGVIILLSAINRTSSVINDSPTYTKYNNYLAPVVMHDPEPFSEITEVSSEVIVSSSIWRNIFQNGLENYQEFDEQGLTLMPLKDVQESAVDLFGPAAKINTEESIFGPFYSYSPGENNFHISTISNLGTFVPYTEEISEKNDELMLKVSYVSREDKFFSVDDKKSVAPTPIKQMIYKLSLNDLTNKYFISSIENK